MKTGENRLENQQKTESPRIKQEGVKQEKVKQEEVKTMHEVEQNKEFFKHESEENAMNKGCLKRGLSAKTTNSTRAVLMLTKNQAWLNYASCFANLKKAHVILSLVKKMDNLMHFLEREVAMHYVDTYSG